MALILGTSSSIFSGSFSGSYTGDGSGLTGVGGDAFPHTGSAIISGSLIVTGSLNVSGSIIPNGSGSYDLGSSIHPWREIHVMSSSILMYDTGGAITKLSAVRDQGFKFEDQSGALTFMSGSSMRLSNNLRVEKTGSIGYIKGTTISGSYIGYGGNLTGISAGFWTGSDETITREGDVQITGSLTISSSNSTSSLTLMGSGSTVFDVIGSTGTLFSVDDDLTGTLFTANDISGLPVLEVSASGDVYIGKSPQSLYTTAVISATSASSTSSVVSLSTSSYDGAFFDYTITSASNAKAGSIMSIWNGGNVTFTETTTTDIGTSAGIYFQVIISQSQAQLVSITDSTAPNTWKVKTIIKAI